MTALGPPGNVLLISKAEDPKTKDSTMNFQDMKITQLRKLAAENNVEGRSTMTKAELAEALEYTAAVPNAVVEVEYTAEERRSAKQFLDDVEQRLNQRQSLFHNRVDWRPEYGCTLEAWNAASDAEHVQLIKEWNMLRDLRKKFGVK